jgi:hypothetical protein
MSKLFIVACKILGLFQLYWALGSLGVVASAFNMSHTTVEGEGQWNPKFYLIMVIIYSILSFFFAFMMVFETETIARIVGLSKSEEIPSLPAQSVWLKTGLILIGVYYFASSIPVLIREIGELYSFISTNRGLSLYGVNPENLTRTVAVLCQFVLAIWIIMKPEKIIHLITRKKKSA